MTDARWFYIERATDGSEARRGPITSPALTQLLNSGTLNAETLVWRNGMDEWKSARKANIVDEHLVPPPTIDVQRETQAAKFSQSKEAPPIEASPNPLASGYLPAQRHPWQRFFARTFDYQMLGFPTALFVFFVSAIIVPSFGIFLQHLSPGEDLLFSYVVIVLVTPLVEAGLLSTVGTTPGKAIWAVKIRTLRGEKLSFDTALRRSYIAALKGMALGIPIVAFFALVFAYNDIKDTGLTSWDRATGSRPLHKPYSFGRRLVVTIAVIFMLAMQGIYRQIGKG